VEDEQKDAGYLFEATYSQRVEFSPGLEAIELGGPGNVWLVDSLWSGKTLARNVLEHGRFGDLFLGKVQVVAEHQGRSLTCRHSVKDIPQFARVVDARRGEAGTVATLEQTAPMIGPTRVHDRRPQVSPGVVGRRLLGAESDENVLDQVLGGR